MFSYFLEKLLDVEFLRIGKRIRRIIYYNNRIKPHAKGCFAFTLFTIIVMIIGILVICFSLEKPSEPCQLAFKLIGNSSISLSSRPRSVAVADVNNDSYLDIVVANSGTDSIVILLLHGNSTVVKETIYSTGPQSHPYSMVVNYFNDDYNLDIAVANYDTNNIVIFLGSGNGTFPKQIAYPLGSSQPLFIISGDFNNDNRSDIAVANNGTYTVSILLGNSHGSFQKEIIIHTGYDSNPYSLAVNDFNHDYYLDIAVANYGTNNIGILLGYGNGSFKSQTTYTTAPNSHPSFIAVGDLDNDGNPDILVANYGTGNIGIFYGSTNGTFDAQRTFSITSNVRPSYITVSDIDKDGILDVVVIDSDHDEIYIVLQLDTGEFSLSTTFDGVTESRPVSLVVTNLNKNRGIDFVVANYGTNNVLLLFDYIIEPSARQMNYAGQAGSGPSSVAIGYFDNNYYLDIVCNAVQDGILILSRSDNGVFTQEANYSTGINSAPQNIRIADLNNDNRTDIVSANTGSGTVGVLLAQSNGTFAKVVTYPMGDDAGTWAIVLVDINNDSYVDIITANAYAGNVTILFGYGNGTFANMATYPIGGTSNANPRAIAVGDINNDSRLDIITANFGANTVTVLLSHSNGTFSTEGTYSTGSGSSPSSIDLADFNNDMQLDIVVANTYTNNIGVFLANKNGTFGLQTIYPTGDGSRPYFVITVDIDYDNILDIAVSSYGLDQIVIFSGDGNGGFSRTVTYLTGQDTRPYGIAAADLNNDTKIELVVALWAIDSIAVFTQYIAAGFEQQLTYLTGSAPQPYSVASGDFNNDNRSDIVVANSGTDNIGVLIGLNNGTFKTQMLYSTGIDSSPQFVTAEDVNRDHKLDLITANTKNDSIALFLGLGNGTFVNPWKYSTGYGSSPSEVIVGDFNYDNRLDLVAINQGTNSIGIFFGFDYVSFSSLISYPSVGYDEPFGIVVNDFNNDHHLDIAVAFIETNNVGVRLGFGNGSFGDMMAYSTGNNSQPTTMTTGDVNNDTNFDIIVPNTLTDNVGILLGYGNGSFAPITVIPTGNRSRPIAVAVGDFNNDNRLDIVLALSRASNIGIFLGYGNGSFGAMITYPTGNSSLPFAVAVGYFNDDDYLDIVVVNRNDNNIGIFLGYGNGSFTTQSVFSTGSQTTTYWVSVADFNGDNQADIAVANYNNNNVGIFIGQGNGSFAAVKTYSTGDGSTPTCLALANFNNDNIYDIGVTSYGSNEMVILFGVGDGTFLLGSPYSTGIGSVPSVLATGDFNNDSRLDIAVANSQTDDICIFLGYNSQLYSGMTKYSTGSNSQPNSAAMGDFNNDDKWDIVVANYGTGSVGILVGSEDGMFYPITTYSTGDGSYPHCVAVDDFNHDNNSDIAVTNSGSDNLAILFGHGDGTFTIAARYLTGVRSRPYTVTIADFDNDKKSDLAIANSGSNNIFLLYGLENGTFGLGKSYPLGYGYGPYSVTAADLNGDGGTDLVVACYGTNNVAILMKMC